MGGKNSKSIVVSQPPAPTVTGFNVKITFDGEEIANNKAETIEEHILQAFVQGKDEGNTVIRRTLDNVAAQVYGNIKEQLAGIEKQGTDRSENLVRSLQEKLSLPVTTRFCSVHEDLMKVCLKENVKTPTSCKILIQNYKICSNTPESRLASVFVPNLVKDSSTVSSDVLTE